MKITIKELEQYFKKIISKLKEKGIEALKEPQTNFYVVVKTAQWANVKRKNNPPTTMGSLYDEIEFLQSTLNDTDSIFLPVHFEYVVTILRAMSYEFDSATKTPQQEKIVMRFQNRKIKITTMQLKQYFKEIINKLRYEIGRNSIEIPTDRYMIIPAGRWATYETIMRPVADIGSLYDDITSLRKMRDTSNTPCTFQDFNRVANLLRAISQHHFKN